MQDLERDIGNLRSCVLLLAVSLAMLTLAVLAGMDRAAPARRRERVLVVYHNTPKREGAEAPSQPVPDTAAD